MLVRQEIKSAVEAPYFFMRVMAAQCSHSTLDLRNRDRRWHALHLGANCGFRSPNTQLVDFFSAYQCSDVANEFPREESAPSGRSRRPDGEVNALYRYWLVDL
ncbi:hypothetical protein D9M72_461740 [compost metagenome]